MSILIAATGFTFALRVLGTIAAFSSPAILALLTRGKRVSIATLDQKDLVRFPVWRGGYVLGPVLTGFGVLMVIGSLHAPRLWGQCVMCGAGLMILALGAFLVYITRVSYIVVARDWVQVQDGWRTLRFTFADLKPPRRVGSLFLLDDGSKRIRSAMIYANSGALLELLERRWAEAHPGQPPTETR